MASNRKIMVLPGDGIGTEIMQANMKIIDWLAKHRSLSFRHAGRSRRRRSL